MINANTLYLQKMKGGADMIDTVSHFGIFVSEGMPGMDPSEAKVDGNSQDWPDEDGLDVFDAERVFMKEFEVEIPMVCVGDSADDCRASSRMLISYMTGRTFTDKKNVRRESPGSLFMIYQPWVGYGRSGARFKGISNHEFWRDESGYTVYTFTMKVEITDPISEVEIVEHPNGTMSLNKKTE